MGESRTELLAWLNDLLQLNYTKIEQVGTGAAYCQIIDSIYGDVQMAKVKFNTKHEYEYVGNYKVLQTAFDKHKIDKVIPVDKLLKCKFQDNLEFLQWVKKFWDQYFPGGDYEATSRRGPDAAGASKSTAAKPAPSGMRKVAAPMAAGRPSSRSNVAAGSGRLSANSGSGGGTDNQSASMIVELNKQITEFKVTVDGLEKERDFYFGKLRDIEIIVQQQIDALEAEGRADETVMLKEVQNILYSTEDGFEVPADQVEGVDPDDETF